jgi:hypothetical protein
VSTRFATRRGSGGHQRTTLDRARPFLFGAIVVGVLVVGAYLAFGDFLNRGGGTTGAIDVRPRTWQAGRRRPA